MRQFRRADRVVQKLHFNTLSRLGDQLVAERGPQTIGLPDVVFEVNRRTGGVDRGRDVIESPLSIRQKLHRVTDCRARRGDSLRQLPQFALRLIQAAFGQMVMSRQLRHRLAGAAYRRQATLNTPPDSVNAEHEEQERAEIGHRHDRHHPRDGGDGFTLLREQHHRQQRECQQIADDGENGQQSLHDGQCVR